MFSGGMVPEQDPVAATIHRAAIRLSKPGAWVKVAMALDAQGRRVFAGSPDAVSWCMLGALRADAPTIHEYEESVDRVGKTIAKRYGIVSISTFNDGPGTKLEDVQNILKLAAGGE